MWRVGTPSPALFRRRFPGGRTHSSPVSSDVNALGEVAGCRLAEKKEASSRREVPAPTSFFGSVQRGFFCRLEKEMQASLRRGLESHPIFGVHVGCPCFVVSERLALHISVVGFSVRSKLQVVHLSQDCKI